MPSPGPGGSQSSLAGMVAATADKSKAFLTVRENYGDNPQPVPSNGIAPGSALRSVRSSRCIPRI
jgi:hypothetical protein